MQLFTHLLSSYLQGMGDFFSALPRGGSPFLLCFVRLGFDSFPLGKVGMGPLYRCLWAYHYWLLSAQPTWG